MIGTDADNKCGHRYKPTDAHLEVATLATLEAQPKQAAHIPSPSQIPLKDPKEDRLDLSELDPEARRRLLWAMVLNCVLLVIVLLSLAGLIIKGHVLVQQEDVVVVKPQQWAVLVAGSRGWDNYRHQADVCHAFHLLLKRGVPEENIVVMMFDDIAYNTLNPDQGEIVNKPNGTNLYPGVPKDYTGENVSPPVFLSVLQGDKNGVKGRGSGKVVESGPEDHVFVYFADHGASGLVAFPSAYLDAVTLSRNLLDMATKRRFAKMLFYLESCESGSMFEGLLTAHTNILAVTASNSTSPSFAAYYDERLNTFLADEFSVAWMEETEVRGNTESILEEVEAVAKMIEKYSKPGIYGDLDLEVDRVGDFQGEEGVIKEREMTRETETVVSYHVPLFIRQKAALAEELHKLMEGRALVEEVTRELVVRVRGGVKDGDGVVEGVRDWDCFLRAVRHYHTRCFNLGENAWALRQVSILASLCDGVEKTLLVTTAIEEVCKGPKVKGLD